MKPRLKELYTNEIQPNLKNKFGFRNLNMAPKLEKIVVNVLNKYSEKVKEYKSGKEKLYGFFVGEIMKASSGKANPKLVNDILKKKLKND